MILLFVSVMGWLGVRGVEEGLGGGGVNASGLLDGKERKRKKKVQPQRTWEDGGSQAWSGPQRACLQPSPRRRAWAPATTASCRPAAGISLTDSPGDPARD